MAQSSDRQLWVVMGAIGRWSSVFSRSWSHRAVHMNEGKWMGNVGFPLLRHGKAEAAGGGWVVSLQGQWRAESSATRSLGHLARG